MDNFASFALCSPLELSNLEIKKKTITTKVFTFADNMVLFSSNAVMQCKFFTCIFDVTKYSALKSGKKSANCREKVLGFLFKQGSKNSKRSLIYLLVVTSIFYRIFRNHILTPDFVQNDSEICSKIMTNFFHFFWNETKDETIFSPLFFHF